MRAVDTVKDAAQEAWGMTWKDLTKRDRHVPLPFMRAVCATVLAEQMGLTQQDACRAVGRKLVSYPGMRRLVTDELETNPRARRMVARFLRQLEMTTAVTTGAVQQGIGAGQKDDEGRHRGGAQV